MTYMRLVEGGSLAIGDGQGRGYVEVCEGLSVKTWSMSFERLHTYSYTNCHQAYHMVTALNKIMSTQDQGGRPHQPQPLTAQPLHERNHSPIRSPRYRLRCNNRSGKQALRHHSRLANLLSQHLIIFIGQTLFSIPQHKRPFASTILLHISYGL